MTEEQKLKLERAKAKARQAGNDPDRGVSVFVNAELDDLYQKLDALLTFTSNKIDEAGEKMANTTKVNLVELNNHLVKVLSLVEQTSKALGERRVEEVIVKNLPAPAKQVIYDDTKQVEELIANRKAIADLKKGLGNIADQIAGGLEELKPGQAPTDFVPFRRVYKAGNRLMFDDDSWVSHGGGAGGSSSSSSDSVIIQDAGGEQATVTGGKLDVNATVSGVGTEYTEDAVAPADPVGGTVMITRDDQLGTVTEAEGDWSRARGTSKGALWVAIADSSGDPITSFGGGTQYTEDAAAAANPVATGLNLVRDDARGGLLTTTDGDNVAARGTNAGELYVKHTDPIAVTQSGSWDEVGINDSGNSITVDGSVTANAGTNLNTSALALEAGGNLAGAATSLAVIDDWDELDRAKVNPIAGQAGVQGASGVVTALTQRVVLATDVALPPGTNAIGKLAANSGVDIGDVDVTSSALPTGASTSAKQPALGTAGTASTDVITIQGIASMTKLLVTPDANSAVNVAQINGVTPLMGAGNTGTGSPRVTIASDQAAVSVTPGGNVAHDAADSGNPVKVGYKAETSPKGITLVADGDRTDAYADADGIQMVKLNTSNADIISERVTNTDGASTALTNFSAVASTRNYVTAITINNSSTTDGTVDFRDGTAGAVLWTMPAPAGGGSVIAAPTALFKTTANTALAFDVSGALSTVTISISGYQSKA